MTDETSEREDREGGSQMMWERERERDRELKTQKKIVAASYNKLLLKWLATTSSLLYKLLIFFFKQNLSNQIKHGF